MNAQKRRIYEFDNFRFDTGERQLMRDGAPVSLPSRAFDLLCVLIENNGHLLGKEELYDLVWHGQIVEESNLTVQMSAIRRALGESRNRPQYIGTVVGNGYRFTADVREINGHANQEVVVESESVERFVLETMSEINIPAEYNGSDAIKVTSVIPRNRTGRKPLILGAIFGGILLFTGFGGYWLYRGGSHASGVKSPESSRQMTMTRLTDGRQLGAPTISPDGKFVAYIENSSAGAGTLYMQQTDTSTVIEMLKPAERTFGCLNFSPDSSLIYYIVYDKRDPNGALYSMPVLGGTPKRILGNLGSCFTVSPDGSRVAFRRANPETKQGSLIIIALDSGEENTLLDYANTEVSFGMGLAWSPDGGLIAVSADNEPNDLTAELSIIGIDAGSGAMRPLTSERFSGVGKMTWTGDGRNLIFVGSRSGGEQKLFLMDYPSGETRQISGELESNGNYGLGVTADSQTLVADVWERKAEIWSVEASGEADKATRVISGASNGRLGIAALPEGQIAYIARTGYNQDVWTAREDGSEAKALTNDSFAENYVTASPDGRFLVFVSDRAGNNHIFRMNAEDGSEVTQLTFGDHAADSRPNVSPDGNWVVYHSYFHTPSVGKRFTIWKVPMAGGAAVQLTDYPSGSPVFSPDGKTIACVLQSESRAKLGSIAVISADGGQPLKQFQVVPFEYTFQTIQWKPDGSAIVFRKPENGVFNLWQQPILGEVARRLTDFQSGAIWNFAYSNDGKNIFLSRGNTFVDVVLIRNFR